MLSVVRDGMD